MKCYVDDIVKKCMCMSACMYNSSSNMNTRDDENGKICRHLTAPRQPRVYKSYYHIFFRR